MTFFLLTKPAAEALHVEGPEFGSVLRELVRRVEALNQYSETDISNLMQTEAGQELLNLNVVDLEGTDPDSYSSNWDDVALASPGPLTDAEYTQVLAGGDPKATGTSPPVELYGAHLKRDQ